LTNDQTVTEEALRNFDHQLRTPDNDAYVGDCDYHHKTVQDQDKRTVAIEAPYATSQNETIDLPERADPNVDEPGRKKKQFIFDVKPSYFAQQTSRASSERTNFARHLGRAAFSFLALALAVACVVAAIAFGQIQSLKSDISAQRRELLFFKERVARLEKIEKEKPDSDQQEEAQNKPDAEKNKPAEETRTGEAGLNLSRDEIQLVRDYIKLAPSGITTAASINVGDPIDGAMIPLPPPLTEKVPRLLGARFITRNGAIIIVKRGSRQADAVLAPN
jgi:hypothetical protein